MKKQLQKMEKQVMKTVKSVDPLDSTRLPFIPVVILAYYSTPKVTKKIGQSISH